MYKHGSSPFFEKEQSSLRDMCDGIGLGKSILKLERGFNIAAGFTSAHDRLPEFFEELCPPHNAVWDFTEKEIDSFWDF